MKYNTNEFIKFLGNPPGTFHIYVKIDDTKDKYEKVRGLPARNNKFVKAFDGKAQLYVSVNPCRMMTKKPKISDVTHWTCEYIDLDVERSDHTVPATEAELGVLKGEINDINNWLGMNGIMNGYSDFTGNGHRWLLPVPGLDLRVMNVKDVMKLNEQKKEFLRIIKRETGANVDTTVGELSRITGIPGTMNVKSNDERDRRREPFRGCHRMEDQNLQDYIMVIEPPEDVTDVEEREFYGTASDIVEGLMIKDKALASMINRATLIKDGHRSEYDYALSLRLRELGVGIMDCIDILNQYGTTKVQGHEKYVKMTAMNAYTKVI